MDGARRTDAAAEPRLPRPGPRRGEQPRSGRAHRGAAPRVPPQPPGPERGQPGSTPPRPGAFARGDAISPGAANCSISLAGAECRSRPRANGRKQTNTLSRGRLRLRRLRGERPDAAARPRPAAGGGTVGLRPPARCPGRPRAPRAGGGRCGSVPPGAAPRARLYLHRACPCINAARRGLSQGPSVSRSLSAAPGEGWPFPRGSALIYVRTAALRGRPRTAGPLAGPGPAPGGRYRRCPAAPGPAPPGHLPAARPTSAHRAPAPGGSAAWGHGATSPAATGPGRDTLPLAHPPWHSPGPLPSGAKNGFIPTRRVPSGDSSTLVSNETRSLIAGLSSHVQGRRAVCFPSGVLPSSPLSGPIPAASRHWVYLPPRSWEALVWLCQ